MCIEKNLQKINSDIKNASYNTGRNPEDIELIAVTKTIDIDDIRKAIELGVTNIGESKVQEIQKKYPHIGNYVKWHMIGHLQKNKVKYIIDKVDLIHSLDSYDLAVEIDNRAKKINRTMECLLQVNVSREESKYGIEKNECKELLNRISKLDNINIVGLMTMAPYFEQPEETRQYFRELKQLAEDIEQTKMERISMKYLSMGMSNDFIVAIEEGANLVRIGSAIFGERE